MWNDNVAVGIPRELYDQIAEATGYQGESLNGWICGVLDAAHGEFGGKQPARKSKQKNELKLTPLPLG